MKYDAIKHDDVECINVKYDYVRVRCDVREIRSEKWGMRYKKYAI